MLLMTTKPARSGRSGQVRGCTPRIRMVPGDRGGRVKVQRAGRFVRMHVGRKRRSILDQSWSRVDLHRLCLTGMTKPTPPLTRFLQPSWHRARPQPPPPLLSSRHGTAISTARQRSEVVENWWHTQLGFGRTHAVVFWLTVRPGQFLGSGDFSYPWLLAVPAGSHSLHSRLVVYRFKKFT